MSAQLEARLETVHGAALVGFAAMLGTFEGPAEIMCVVVLLTTALTGRLRGLSALHPVFIGVAVWMVAGVPGVLTAPLKVESQGYLRPLHALALFAGGFALRDVPARVLRQMTVAFCGGLVLNGAYGILQVFVGELPLDGLLLRRSSTQIYVPGSRTERCASGLFYNRIRLAHMGAIGLSVFAIIIRFTTSKRTRALAVAGAAVLGCAVLLTYARMVLVAWVGAVGLLVLWTARPRRAALIAGASGLAAALVSFSPGGRRRLGKTVEDLGIRRRIFSMALEIFEGHPWLGTGHGAYQQHARALLRPTWSRNWTVDAHNLYLHTATETGLIGLVGFMAAIGYSFVRLARAVRNPEARDPRLAQLNLLVLLMLLLLGTLHQPLHHAAVGLVFFFAVGFGAFHLARDAG